MKILGRQAGLGSAAVNDAGDAERTDVRVAPAPAFFHGITGRGGTGCVGLASV
jgi:hypothetical protein